MKLCTIYALVLSLGPWINLITCTIIAQEFCDQESLVHLAPNGKLSSVTILLNPKDHKKICRLNITAPTSHLINMQWQVEIDASENATETDSFLCPLSIFLPEDKAVSVWKGNPCTRESLPDVDLLTPNLLLTWNPPRFGKHVIGRKLVITAVGQDEVCIQKGQHVCMRVGWKPMLCVSDELVCDGNLNCPKGSSRSDEDPRVCKVSSLNKSSWKRLTEDVIRKLPKDTVDTAILHKKNGTKFEHYFQIDLMSLKDIKSYEVSVTLPDSDHHDTEDSVSAAIAHYGTWGYLMLAMLVVGTILMFCGLWECCFRKPKPQLELQTATPSTTVLIINRPQHGNVTLPPNYEDLDQPPTYAALFPTTKANIRNLIQKNETISCGEELVADSFSSACDSSDEQSDYVSINSTDNLSNRFYNSSDHHTDSDGCNDEHSANISIVTSL